MRKTYNMHLLWAQLLHNYFQEGENIGIIHNIIFLWHEVSFSLNVGERTEPYAISSHLKLPKHRCTQRETHVQATPAKDS